MRGPYSGTILLPVHWPVSREKGDFDRDAET
jgi:hypothetical protein